jgi:hypothetical protein
MDTKALKPREELLAEWLAALRSGTYSQARGKLKIQKQDGTTGYCCLGVLCEIAGLEQSVKEWAEEANGNKPVLFAGDSTILPERLRKHMKLRTSNGVFVKPEAPINQGYQPNYVSAQQAPISVDGREYTTLTVCNDGKRNDFDEVTLQPLNFAQIADIIEQKADLLFYTE